MQESILATVILPSSLFLIMFGLGLSLQLKDFKLVLEHPRAVFIGLLGQMVLLPFAAFAIAIFFELPPELAVGLVIIALAPGGATSNMFTYLARGDVALSISLTLVVSAITPFTIPIVLFYCLEFFIGSSNSIELPVVKTMLQLLVITVVPVSLGMMLKKVSKNIATKIENIIKWFSIVFLMLIVIIIFLQNTDEVISYIGEVGYATLVLNCIVLLMGYCFARLWDLSVEQSTTIGFEVGIQNGTLAMMIAGTLIGNEVMMIPAIVYSVLMFFTGAAFCSWILKGYKKQQEDHQFIRNSS